MHFFSSTRLAKKILREAGASERRIERPPRRGLSATPISSPQLVHNYYKSHNRTACKTAGHAEKDLEQ